LTCLNSWLGDASLGSKRNRSAVGPTCNGQVLNLAARHKDGRWVMVYLGGKASFSINLNKLAAGSTVKAFWIDPRTGEPQTAGRPANSGSESFSTPDGWEDALLILEASSS